MPQNKSALSFLSPAAREDLGASFRFSLAINDYWVAPLLAFLSYLGFLSGHVALSRSRSRSRPLQIKN